jgi:hypothetical protein
MPTIESLEELRVKQGAFDGYVLFFERITSL